MLHAKNNLSVPPEGLAFRLKETIVREPGKSIVASCVDWETEPVDITANEAMAADNNGARDHEQREAMEFLTNLLADGRQPAKEVQEAAKGQLITPITLRRARERVGVLIEREGFGKDGVSYWSPPPSILDHMASENGGNRHTCSPNEVSKYDKHRRWRLDRPEITPRQRRPGLPSEPRFANTTAVSTARRPRRRRRRNWAGRRCRSPARTK